MLLSFFYVVDRLLAQSIPPCTVVHANRAFSELSGLTSEQLLGQTLSSIIHEANAQAASASDDEHFVRGCLKSKTISSQDNDEGSRNCRMRTFSVREERRATKDLRHPVTHFLVQVKSPGRAKFLIDGLKQQQQAQPSQKYAVASTVEEWTVG